MQRSIGRLAMIGLADEDCPEICEGCEARATSICRALPHAELHRLADHAVLRDFAAGEIIARQGDRAEYATNITAGVVMISKLLSDGRRQVLGFLMRGDFLGLQATVDNGFTAEAVGPVSVCRFPRAAFRRLVEGSHALEQELLRRASDELDCCQAHVVLLGRKTARERVASFLLDLANRSARHGGVPDLIEVPMTRADIADYLGLTTETVSRVLSSLKRGGQLQLLAHGVVRITRRAELEAMAEAG